MLYQLKDLNETWWAFEVDGKALFDNVYTWFQPTQPEFVFTKSVAKNWLLPGQEILYQLKDLNETWWALAVDGYSLPDKVLLGSNQHSQSLCSVLLTKSVAKTWLLPGKEILYQFKDLNETWWALAVDGNAIPVKVLLGSNQYSQSLCSPSPW